jgi:hypothetical protein
MPRESLLYQDTEVKFHSKAGARASRQSEIGFSHSLPAFTEGTVGIAAFPAVPAQAAGSKVPWGEMGLSFIGKEQ